MNDLNNKNIKTELSNILESAKKLILNSDHYSGNIETIDFIKDKLSDDQFEGYLLGNSLKYLSRYNKHKTKQEDLNKSFTYLLWLLQLKGDKANE